MRRRDGAFDVPDNPLWYKDAVIYQTHVRAFHDSNADGIGDFRGLTAKLDYLKDLGVTAIWLLPFYPSPLKDDGYDIADYTDIHPAYGTLRDFDVFLRQAHERGIRVITELVINHTSDQHPWFQRARRAPWRSKERDFYVWNETPDKYKGARIIFKDFELSNWSLDPVAGAHYWHRFYAHQPDLNFDNPEVHKTVFRMLEFWLKRGVDGLRLDAIPYLYEREGTSCENLPETHAFLKDLRRHIDQHFKNRMLLAEANQWPEDAVAYFGDGDESHMAFHFPFMPRMFMAIRMEDRYPLIDILQQTPAIPESAQWAMFLRNHDELTLEMVTDRERDYMYQAYARDRETRINLGIRRRLAPLLGNERPAIELMNGLLFSLPGTPVMYYGDEIGMGDNVYLGDRNGVRTPMQWSADRNAGFSRANPHRLYLPIIIDPEYHYEAVNVQVQQNNPRSLLWWMKRLIRLRKRYQAFGRGRMDFLQPTNPKILAFLRQYEEERLLVIANLSRFAQSVELDLSPFQGMVLVELFGQTTFPMIRDTPYAMTLGPYGFYWLSLEPQRLEVAALMTKTQAPLPPLKVTGTWENAFKDRYKAALEERLPEFLKTRRWFGGKARRIQSTTILDAIRMAQPGRVAYFLLLVVEYTDSTLETYALPLTFATGERADTIRQQSPAAVLVGIRGTHQKEGLLYDAMWDENFAKMLLDAITRRRTYAGAGGELTTSTTRRLRPMLRTAVGALKPSVSSTEQSNTCVCYGDKLVLKLFRRLEPGVNPDLEIGRFLTDKRDFPHIPPVMGAIEYRQLHHEPMTLAILQGFVPNQGDAWQYTLDVLGRYFEWAAAKASEVEAPPGRQKHLLDALDDEPPPLAKELMGFYLEHASLLGQRTAEMHLALASDTTDANFAPEPFTDFYQRSQYQGMRSLTTQVFQLLRSRLKDLPEGLQTDAQRVLEMEREVQRRFRAMRDQQFSAMRLRIHGDYHLGQVLYTGKDFVIIDFEGEPARSFSERRNKASALRDVGGMLRSFHYASFAAAVNHSKSATLVNLAAQEPWRRFWYEWVTASFTKGYLTAANDAVFLPKARQELRLLLEASILDKAVYELAYELNNRPPWVGIPLHGILHIIEAGET